MPLTRHSSSPLHISPLLLPTSPHVHMSSLISSMMLMLTALEMMTEAAPQAFFLLGLRENVLSLAVLDSILALIHLSSVLAVSLLCTSSRAMVITSSITSHTDYTSILLLSAQLSIMEILGKRLLSHFSKIISFNFHLLQGYVLHPEMVQLVLLGLLRFQGDSLLIVL